mmetsp:Transcript_50721/g.135216  ORF Transcript_50721/g.135216 Transcript_50721/m.135216 type:complete len:216 (+) Transcript_50721:703-1350(+)
MRRSDSSFTRGRANPPHRKEKSTRGGRRWRAPHHFFLAHAVVLGGNVSPTLDEAATSSICASCASSLSVYLLCKTSPLPFTLVLACSNHSLALSALSRSASIPRSFSLICDDCGVWRSTTRFSTTAKSSTVAAVSPNPRSTNTGGDDCAHDVGSSLAHMRASTARSRPDAVLPRVGTTITDAKAFSASIPAASARRVRFLTASQHRCASASARAK